MICFRGPTIGKIKKNMHEVITIAVSHRANHLATQFFNNQEQYLYYQKDNNPTNSDVFLNPTIDKISKTVSYSPRALIWDAKTGVGSLGTFQYSQNEGDHFRSSDSNIESKDEYTNDNTQLVFTHPQIEKSQYQIALDKGLTLPELTPSLTKYWSDYSKLIYHPSSISTLNEWYHDVENPNTPDFQKLGERKFTNYDLGFNEFNDNYLLDFFDNNLHFQLEACDTLQGFNIITDFNNAWGGFAAALLVELKNDLPKNSVFTYGFNENDSFSLCENYKSLHFNTSMYPLISNKIKSTLTFSEESDLVFPLFVDSTLSNWENCGLLNKVFEGVNSIINEANSSKRHSMEYLANLLKTDDSSRNVLSNMIDENGQNFSYSSKVLTYKNSPTNYHEFSNLKINRSSTKVDESQKKTEKKPNTFELCSYQYKPSDTIPNEYRKNADNTAIELSMNEYSRNEYLYWTDFVSRFFRNDPDREGIKDQLATKASVYEYGWYDDVDSEDDIY